MNEEVGMMNDESKKDGNSGQARSSFITHHSSLASVTFGITAFERPGHLARLVESVLRFYPAATIVVADNGSSKAHLPHGVCQLDVPYDCGLSAARNALIDACRTPYLLILEEDFLFTHQTRIEQFVDVLESHREVGLVAGSLLNRSEAGSSVVRGPLSDVSCNHGPGTADREQLMTVGDGILKDYALDLELCNGYMEARPSRRRMRVTASGTPYRLCDKTYNFFLARRELLQAIRWDERLKLGEHTDFFWRIKNANAEVGGVNQENAQVGMTNDEGLVSSGARPRDGSRPQGPRLIIPTPSLLHRSFLVAHTPAVIAVHDISGRSGQYEQARARAWGLHKNWYQQAGLLGYRQDKGVHYDKPDPDRPNLIMLGVGHAYTTVTARMLAALGWHTPDADERFCEHRAVRRLNEDILLRGKSIDSRRALQLLEQLPEPWLVKDPRMALTLEAWLPALGQLERPPLLIWLDRGLDELSVSYRKRGEIDPAGNLLLDYQRGHTLESLRARAQQMFELYPWPKLRIEAGQLRSAIAQFQRPEIPKMFHRIWLSGSEGSCQKPMPEEFVRFGRTWSRLNPNWQLRDWSERDIEEMAAHKPLVTGDLWKRARNFSQASDVLRYELLWRFGGVYLDTDFEALKPLGSLLAGASFVGAGEKPDALMISAGFIGAVPQHPIVGRVLAMLPERMASDLPQAQATGPGLVSEAWRWHLYDPGVVRYGPELFYPYSWTEPQRRWEKFPGAVAVHHWAGSWMKTS